MGNFKSFQLKLELIDISILSYMYVLHTKIITRINNVWNKNNNNNVAIIFRCSHSNDTFHYYLLTYLLL